MSPPSYPLAAVRLPLKCHCPGCESNKVNCYPFTWKTFPEYLEDAGISWQVYQDFDNFEDNMLAYFVQYQNAPNGSALREKGNSYPGLAKFQSDAKAGTLPQVSWIVGPQELSEHPPNMPKDGAWLQQQVIEAVTSSPAFDKTALLIMYDEGGGWGDHVVPFVPPKGSPGDWIIDPFNNDTKEIPVGPGFRVPAYMISPWDSRRKRLYRARGSRIPVSIGRTVGRGSRISRSLQPGDHALASSAPIKSGQYL